MNIEELAMEIDRLDRDCSAMEGMIVAQQVYVALLARRLCLESVDPSVEADSLKARAIDAARDLGAACKAEDLLSGIEQIDFMLRLVMSRPQG